MPKSLPLCARWCCFCLWTCALAGCAQMALGPPAPVLASAAGLRQLGFSEIASGVFVHLGALQDWGPANAGDVANLGFVVGTRCVAVIDSGGTPAIGQALLAAVRHASPLPVCYVINTHAHPDHVLGNVAFVGAAERPRFVASAHFGATLAARAPYYLAALQRDFGVRLSPAGVVYPDRAVAQALELDLGGRILTLQAWPTAHTDNDLTVYDQRTRTLFAGDLLFVQHLPVLDGNLRGWLCTLEALRSIDVASVLPGHGSPSTDWPAVLNAERDYLQGLQQQTRAAIAQGLSLAQAAQRIGLVPTTSPNPAQRLHRPDWPERPHRPSWQLAEHYQRRNVTAAYAELEWEEGGANKPGDAPCKP